MMISYKKLQKRRLFTLFGLFLIIFCLILFEFIPLMFKIKKQSNEIILENKFSKNSQITGKITISGNWSATKSAGICSGSGTYSDPYVIKELIIDGGGGGVGIVIVNSKKIFFRIEKCIIFNCWYGIRLLRSCNGTLLNNNCSNNENGIYLDGWTDNPRFTHEEYLTFYCMNNTLINNCVNNNEYYGILMRHSDNNSIISNDINYNENGIYISYIIGGGNNTIIYNSLIANKEHGIFLEIGADNVIKENIMISCGFFSWDKLIFTYNVIDTTNLVNGGHLYFYANMTDLNDDNFLNAGQIYLVNCNNSIISNLDLSDGSVSISLFECRDIKITHNNLSSNNLFGIYLENCDNITIAKNLINENLEGIDTFSLSNSVISENEVNNNYGMYGIYINGHNNLISRNNIKNNADIGLRIWLFCENNTIFDNNIENNRQGIYLFNSFSNISENVIAGNLDVGLHLGGGSINNTIFLNFFRDNGLHVSGGGLNNNWNNSKIGNYWDNYTGIDANGDGIGDTPHNITISPLIQDHLPIVDDDPPIITIIKPTNNSKFKGLAPDFELAINERFLDLMWYTLNDGLINYTFTKNGTIDQNAWNELSNGQIKLRFYALDKPGHLEFKEIMIYKDIHSLDLPFFIVLSVIITTIAIVSVSIILITLKRRKLVE